MGAPTLFPGTYRVGYDGKLYDEGMVARGTAYVWKRPEQRRYGRITQMVLAMHGEFTVGQAYAHVGEASWQTVSTICNLLVRQQRLERAAPRRGGHPARYRVPGA